MATVTHHPVGETASDLRPGDIILTGITATNALTRLIKFGAWLRHYEKPYRRFSHAALVVSEQGDIVEALSDGVVRSHLSRYSDDDYVVVRTQIDDHDVAQVLAFADNVVAVRTRYGVLTFVGLALYCLTGAKLSLEEAGTAICSGFVSDALTRAGFIWPRPPFAMMPADLARYFEVQ